MCALPSSAPAVLCRAAQPISHSFPLCKCTNPDGAFHVGMSRSCRLLPVLLALCTPCINITVTYGKKKVTNTSQLEHLKLSSLTAFWLPPIENRSCKELSLYTLVTRGRWNYPRFFFLACLFCDYKLDPDIGSGVEPANYCVWKGGQNLRMDTTLLGFDHMTWQRGNRSFVFRGQGEEGAGGCGGGSQLSLC